MARQLTTASTKLNWELKGYATGFLAGVQTLSIVLPVLCRKNASTLHTSPERKRLHYSHLAGSVCRSPYILSPAQHLPFQYLNFPALQQRRCTKTPKLMAKLLNGETNLASVTCKKPNNYCSSHCFPLSHTQVTAPCQLHHSRSCISPEMMIRSRGISGVMQKREVQLFPHKHSG